MARLRNLRVHVVEEGYIRPDYLTLQEDGVNGNSTLPLDPEWYLEQARALPPEDNGREPQIPSTFRQRAFNTGRNGMASALMRPAFPFYRTHRPNSFLWETVGWFKKPNLRQAEHGTAGEQGAAGRSERG